MPRYIDADALKEKVEEIEWWNENTGYYEHIYIVHEYDIDDAPTANVAPIADTVKKMQERLIYTLCINNEENTEFFDYSYTLETIDQIAKEMLEGKDEV